jgi:hypothetical protein
MSDGADWRHAFAAFAALLGEPADAVALALGEAPPAAIAGDPTSAPAARAARARAVAAVVTRIVAELERMTLR